jgi:adenosyl cobinamide kinase/adenosyl cobinamide phosphate guanylyltransferase
VNTLVLGGARSGKSLVAEGLAAALPKPVTYLATAVVADADHAARVATHRARRDPTWRTVETGATLVDVLRIVPGSVLVDSVGSWLAAHPDFRADSAALCEVLAVRPGDAVLVSEEVGLGVHPASAAGREFRDALGRVNVEIAEMCDRVLFVVAGRVLPLERAE